MKRRCFVTTVLGVFMYASPAFAQNQTTDRIQWIRDHYALVQQHLPNYSCATENRDDLSTEGTEVTICRDHGALRKVTIGMFGEMGKASYELYFWDGDKPFFGLVVESRYEKPFGKTALRSEDRFYFDEGHLVRWVGPDGKKKPVDSGEAREHEKELAELVATVLEPEKTKQG